jgi:hypothetical protein
VPKWHDECRMPAVNLTSPNYLIQSRAGPPLIQGRGRAAGRMPACSAITCLKAPTLGNEVISMRARRERPDLPGELVASSRDRADQVAVRSEGVAQVGDLAMQAVLLDPGCDVAIRVLATSPWTSSGSGRAKYQIAKPMMVMNMAPAMTARGLSRSLRRAAAGSTVKTIASCAPLVLSCAARTIIHAADPDRRFSADSSLEGDGFEPSVPP